MCVLVGSGCDCVSGSTRRAVDVASSGLAANRGNAEHSSGPITPEGKARAAANSLSCGLFTASSHVEPGEEPAYAAFTEAYCKQLAPDGPVEESLVIEIVAAAWRLRRCGVIESRLPECDDPEAT